MRTLLLCALFSAFSLHAAELTGKWSGSFDITNEQGETQADSAYMDLKESGGAVTGTAGPTSDKQWPLQKGKLDGQKLTFEVALDDGGIMAFELTFDGTSIQGSCKGTGSSGETLTAKVNLKRAS